jgi:hypothetical protein
MKKKLILSILVVIGVSLWFFWPSIRLSFFELPQDRHIIWKALSVNDDDFCGGGGTLHNSFGIYDLGFGRSLILNTTPRTEGDLVFFAVTHAEIKYQFKSGKGNSEPEH